MSKNHAFKQVVRNASSAARAEPLVPSWKRQSMLKKYPQSRLPSDGCQSASYVAYAWSDQAFIYPITPATAMGDCVANWAGAGRKNLFGEICEVTQMQSEAGAAGACHGVVDVGASVTTFTSSQGLLLMVPNMYIMAGALNPLVFHVAARAITKHALCIFGDHTDVMATRQTGFAILAGNNVQQTMDMALVSHIATLKTSVPFMNFFDGFRTSHEISKPMVIPYEAMQQMVPWEELRAHRARGLNPNKPHSRQLGQFQDTFFQNAEAINKYYDQTPAIVQEVMNDVGFVTGRNYSIFLYKGHPQAEHVVVAMGSGACVVDEYLQSTEGAGKKYGIVHTKLFRPWDAKAFLDTLPRTVKTITVLDRTKESGGVGEPLYMDVATSLVGTANHIKILGGRFGLGSREFTPGMAAAVFDNAQAPVPKNSFSVGIEDDVTFRSLVCGPEPDTCPPGTRQCIFWGMGSDGTVSANKNAIKLIGENTDMFVQGYFRYDSKKAGGCTISHLRFGPTRFESPYEVLKADYIAVSETTWPKKFGKQLLHGLRPGAKVVINTRASTPEEAEALLPHEMLHEAANLGAEMYFIDAEKVARSNGLGRHTNNVLSMVFFKLSDVIEWERAKALLENNVKKVFRLKGEDVIARNLKGMSEALAELHHIKYDKEKWLALDPNTPVDYSRPVFVREIMDKMTSLTAEALPVSSFDPRGHFPNDTCKYEKRGIAYTVPVVDMNTCTQCNKCAAICPHAAIRPFLLSQDEVDAAPREVGFEAKKAKGGVETSGLLFRIQVAPEDCTGCEACSWACGDASLTMTPLKDVAEEEIPKWNYMIDLPNRGHLVDRETFKGSQFQKPYLEFSGACEGCGETPYAKLVTQLFGHRMVIANASGCSSVWSGTAGFSPFSTNEHEQGPAWGRSLFEDAAEYGFGMARAIKQKRDILAGKVEEALFTPELELPQKLTENFREWLEKKEDPDIAQEMYLSIPAQLNNMVLTDKPLLQDIQASVDGIPKVSTWVWGGDGWAYDIGFGGVDHVLAGGTQVNILVMDTEGYSNTGGQVSKATNLGAVQKFAPEGYRRAKKDLGAIAMAYEDVYVASCSMGANYGQTVKAMVEGEAYPGTSLLLCYSPCIEHKILFPRGLSRLAEEMKFAATSGYWPLYRYDPAKTVGGDNPFTLDQKALNSTIAKFTGLENRFQTLHRSLPDVAVALQDELQEWSVRKHDSYKWLASRGKENDATGAEVLLLVGTDTGVTQDLAQRTADQMRARNFNVTMMELNEVADIDDLANKENIMLMCSTAGEGDMPGTADSFWEFINDPAIDTEAKPLKGVKLSSFGLGDTAYRYFNKAVVDIETRLQELGAVSVIDTGMGNDQDDDKAETAFEEWLPNFWQEYGATEEPDADLIGEPAFEMEAETENWSYQVVCPPSTKKLTLEYCSRITPADYDRTIYHLRFDRSQVDYPFLLGDAMSIYPHNDPAQVGAFLQGYLKGFDLDTTFKVTPMVEMDKRRMDSYRRPMSARQIFTEIVDILGRPNKHFYKNLAKFAVDEAEKAQLQLIVSDTPEGKAAYKELSDETVTYADVLNKFKSAHPPLEHLISMIPCVKPRLYSIASSPRYMQDHVELMIVILDWDTPNGTARRGLSTDFINRLCTDGDDAKLGTQIIPVGLTNGTFNFPEDTMVPMIMTGLGTGLAPFRAFAQEWVWWRETMGRETGPMWLFYGVRKEKMEFSGKYGFADELKSFVEKGVLTELRCAFSRDTKEKVYVQHKMSDAAEPLYTDLVEKGGYFYLCGQAGALEIDVENAIKKATKMQEPEASEYVERMHEEGRYNLELY